MSSQQQLASPAQTTAPADYAQSTDIISQAPVCEQDAGNQAAVQDAGMDTAAPAQDDGSLRSALEAAGTVILDAMPLSIALGVARQFIDTDGVRDWVDQLDTRQVGAELDTQANSILEQLWPVGTGLTSQAALGGKIGLGPDVEGTLSLLRSDRDALTGTYENKAEFSLGSLAVGAGQKDAFGDQTATAMAQAGLAATGQVKGELSTTFSLGALLAAGAIELIDLLSAGMVSPTLSVALTRAIAPEFAQDPWKTTWDLSLGGTAKATAGAQLDTGAAQAMLDANPEIAALLPTLAGLAELEAAWQVGLRFEEGGMGLAGKCGVKDLANLTTTAPWLLELTGLGDLVEQSQRSGAGYEVEFFFGLSFGEGGVLPVDAVSSIKRVSSETATNPQTGASATVKDQTTTSIPAFVASLGQADGESLADLLANGGASFTRQIEIPVDPSALSAVFPDWIEWAARSVHLDHVPTKASMALKGSIQAGQGLFASLAGVGFQPPAGWSGAAALDAIGQSLVSLRAGGGVAAAWLEPYRSDLAHAASGIELQAPRAVGSLLAGGGLGASAAVGPVSGSAEARASGGVLFDLPLAGEQAERVTNALREQRAA